MPIELLIALSAVFVAVAVVSGSVVSVVLSRSAPERRRLREMTQPKESALVVEQTQLTDTEAERLKRLLRLIPKSPHEMNRLRQRLATAGHRTLKAAVVFSLAELILPIVLGLAVIAVMGPRAGWMVALFAAVVGFLLPSLVLARLIEVRKREIRNGLPDALDLLIVCVEAGSSLDQAVVKTTDELDIAYPALADELQLLTTEVRAGKPRLEAFRNLAARTRVEDVRSLVAMLVQTDRFGTSIAQALRTHAETLRTKRRQRAEERAAKVGVKLVFPLVFCLFPAFYVVTLGPAIIQFVRVFFGQVVR